VKLPAAAATVAALLAGVALASCSSSTPQTPVRRAKPNVVFILIDALRADRLPFYGNAKDTAPFLTEIAAKGAVFEQAFAVSSWTPSSMASIFTSLYPNQHQVLTGFRATVKALKSGEDVKLNRLPSKAEVMPEVMATLGYRSYGVADNPNLCDAMGFTRGFTRFAPRGRRHGAKVLNGQVLEWAPELRSGAPYFLYVHYMECHEKYQRQPGYFDPRTPPEDRELAAYDSNIRFLDDRIKELWTALGWDENTLVIVTADHGEEFGDHGGTGHGNQVYQELLHVPLLAYYPARLKPQRVTTPVSTIDLLPTFRELGGGRAGRQDQGVSLLATVAGRAPQPRIFFPMRWWELVNEPCTRKVVLALPWKLILTQPKRRVELFDLSADPKEKKNVAASNAAVVRDLESRLVAFEKGATVFEREYGSEVRITRQQAEQLKALGYVQ
jgi:arylsulfatase A-like enzyme